MHPRHLPQRRQRRQVDRSITIVLVLGIPRPRYADLERALAKLPDEQRSALLLVGMEGMQYEEVAAVLDVPVGTVRSRLSRGREALRQLMGIAAERREPEPRRRVLAA